MATWKRLLIAVTGPLAVAWALGLVSAPPAFTQASLNAKPPPPPPPPTPVLVTNLPLPTQVISSPASPLVTQGVDNPAQQPFAAVLRPDIPNGAFGGSLMATLGFPAGFRLEIDHVSVEGEVPTGQRFLGVGIWTLLNGESTPSFIGAEFNGHSPIAGLSNGNAADIFSGSTEFHAAVDAGANNVKLLAIRNLNAELAPVFVTLRGHLVPLL